MTAGKTRPRCPYCGGLDVPVKDGRIQHHLLLALEVTTGKMVRRVCVGTGQPAPRR